jgi:tRNA wybutosine-synthesizing protein 4
MVSFNAQKYHPGITCPATFGLTTSSPRPLLVGMSVLSVNDSLIIMGGSATCFSFGTFWNKGCFTINVLPTMTDRARGATGKPKSLWQYMATGTATIANTSKGYSGPQRNNNFSVGVPRAKVQTSEEFSRIVNENKPVILEGLNLGSCTDIWTSNYLKEKIGPEREVSSIFRYSLFSSTNINAVRLSSTKLLRSIWIFRLKISPT